MNEFASTENSGLLKDNYGDSPLAQALKKKREKLAQTKIGLETEDEKEGD